MADIIVVDDSDVVSVPPSPGAVLAIPEGPAGPRGITTNINTMTASAVAPSAPQVNDLWVDIS